MKDFYVVRYPNNQFLPTKGKEPTGSLAEAKRFEAQADAEKGAGQEAVGVSLYGHEDGKPVALKHMGLTKPELKADN